MCFDMRVLAPVLCISTPSPHLLLCTKTNSIQKQKHQHIQGLFSDSIPRFRKANPDLPPMSYLHVDCDLYEGSRDALHMLNDLIVPGMMLLFTMLFLRPLLL